jgi:signal transduction histidine kinase/ligand-binding sensor domain-containing protein
MRATHPSTASPAAYCSLLAIALFVCASIWSCATHAQQRRIDQLYHSAWTIKDGAPGQISSLAQTSDGYLWMTAAAGLYRFDGVNFERIAAAPEDPDLPGTIRTLYAPRGGGLWLGFNFGGISFVKDGRITRYSRIEGVPAGNVLSMETDADGVVWVAALGGLARLEGNRWRPVGADWSYPSGTARFIYLDRSRRLWVASDDELFFLPPGERKFRATGLRVKWVNAMAEDSTGRLWVAEGNGIVQPLERAQSGTAERWSFGVPKIQMPSAGLLFDDQDALWVTTLGDGMRRLTQADQNRTRPILAEDDSVESFTHLDGLTANYVWPMLRDREGNVWVGTSAGLDQFRPSTLVLSQFPAGAHDFALVADREGAIWAGTTNRELMRLSKQEVARFPAVPPFVTCAYRDRDGTLLFGAPHGLWQVDGEKITKLTDLPGAGVDRPVQALARDGSGALWVSLKSPAELFKFARGRWTQVRLPEAPENGAPNVAIGDDSGAVWFGYNGNVALRVDGQRVQRFSAEQGLNVGNIFAIQKGRDALWIGGVRGIASFDGTKFRTLQVTGDVDMQNVSAIIETADGSLWLHAVPGIFRVPAEEVRRARNDPTYLARHETFDFLDGLPGRPTLAFPFPTAVASNDGRLWFATSDGVAWIDPSRIARNPIAPPVTIRALRANGLQYQPGRDLSLPVRTNSLQIDYAALSLSVPQRVRYRYKLGGLDQEWQEPGQRREAIYTNLAPGQYRFQVIAANDDGVWNETGATLDFSIPPTFTQTSWFIGLCALLAIGIVWLLYWIRMRNVAARIKGRLEERIGERERIARELHDTLLQGVQGLMLRFQTAMERIPEHEPAREIMAKALDRADDILIEGRDRVNDLRSGGSRAIDLSTVLAQVGEEFARDYPAQFLMIVTGTPRPLHPVVRDEIYGIAREALANAFKHAEAHSIEVEIVYDRRELRVHVRDDGRGIDAAIIAAGGRQKHWGLTGMRERARQIRAHFQLWSRPGAGAEIELRIPTGLAYQTRPRSSAWRRWLDVAPDVEPADGGPKP